MGAVYRITTAIDMDQVAKAQIVLEAAEGLAVQAGLHPEVYFTTGVVAGKYHSVTGTCDRVKTRTATVSELLARSVGRTRCTACRWR
ncbi:MAG: hypothetical protein JWP14_384 [Frankiales bacterium]|nr:hypothetical protein [Frankiales bacterium]